MSSLLLFANNASTTLSSSVTSGATSISVNSASAFPSPTGSQYFYCTLQGISGTPIEIVKVTAVSGTTFTVVRAQEGTTASAFSAGDKVELRLTAAGLNTLLQTTNNLSDVQSASTALSNLGGAPLSGAAFTGSVSATSISSTSSVSDSIGNVRSITVESKTSSYTLASSDNGQIISITTGGVTAPASVLSAGQVVTIYNNSASSQTITQGSGLTLQWAGQSSSTTGNRTLGLYGVATILYISSTNAIITGAGLT